LDNIIDQEKLCEYGEGKIYKKKEPSLTKTLALTLKEVYFGAEKKIKILRRVFEEGNSGQTVIREKILDITVRPGTRAGTVFTFPNAGDMSFHSIPGLKLNIYNYFDSNNYI
jgi:DnaJ family protein B protein 13